MPFGREKRLLRELKGGCRALEAREGMKCWIPAMSNASTPKPSTGAATRQPALCRAHEDISQAPPPAIFRNFKGGVGDADHARHLLCDAVAPLGRGTYAPDQAVLVDIANRRFYFFFIEIWPQEFFIVAGMLVMAGHRPVPDHLDRGPRVVRLIPARRPCGSIFFLVVERWVGVTAMPHQARCRTLVDGCQDRQARGSSTVNSGS